VVVVVAIVVLIGAMAYALNLANAPTPPPPTLAPPATLDPLQLTATQDAAATQAARQQQLKVTLAAVMQMTPGRQLLGILPPGTLPPPTGAQDFVAQNAWVGLINNTWTGLYAGALRSDPEQGALLLVTITDERVDQEHFVVPLSHGALRITAQNVQRLTLTAPDGTTYFFDVQARRFVSSLIDYADTATPLPSYTPSTTATITPTPTVTPIPPTPTTSATPTVTPIPLTATITPSPRQSR